MTAVERPYRSSTVIIGSVTCLIGLAMIVTTLARGGGPLAVGVVVGVLFALLGAGRVFLAGRRPRSGRA
jgi:uncharacterized membrane protein YccC